MEAFIEKFSRKYNLPAADCLRLPLCDLFDLYAALIGLMERRAQDGQ